MCRDFWLMHKKKTVSLSVRRCLTFRVLTKTFWKISTVDDTWVYACDVETKVQSLQWMGKLSPRRKTQVRSRSNVKVKMILFHVHNAITACLTQLSTNFDWFHATQVEESIITRCSSNVNVAISVSKTLLQLDFVTSIQRVVRCCHLASPNPKNSHVSSNNFHVSLCFRSREKN